MIYAWEDCEVDLERFEVRRSGSLVHVEPQVFDFIAYLVRNHDRLVPKDELIEHLWPEKYISEAALNSRLLAARRALGDDGRAQRLIRTVHGRGYRFLLPVTMKDPQPAFVGEAPAPPAGPARPEPPRPATSFVGRERELRRIRDLLASPDCRLLTIVGPGGMGKTRLATEAMAEQLALGAPASLVSLASASADADIGALIAAGLGIQIGGRDPAVELCDQLAHRTLLLVLDNCEPAIPPLAALIPMLLERAPGVRCMITSREVLGLLEEWVLPVDGLPVESAGERYPDAVRLFLDRERQASALREAPNDTDLQAIARICERVEGMPLAIELAASLTRYLSYDAIAGRVSDDLDLLRGDFRDLPERHRSIHALMDESCRCLPPDELESLLCLAVFEGSFTAEAAATVAGAQLHVLAHLVDHSLVQAREGRFSLHPLMRQYARSRIGSRLGDELAPGHAAYFTEFLSRRREALQGARQVEAVREVHMEFTEIEAAWRWAAAQLRLDLLQRALHPLFVYLQLRARYAEAYALARVAIDAAECVDDRSQLVAELMVQFAWTELRTGHNRDIVAAATRAANIYTELGVDAPPGLGADPRTPLAVLAMGEGRYEEAIDLASSAAETALARADDIGAAFALWITASSRLRQAELAWVPDDQIRHYEPAAESTRHDAAEDARALLAQAQRLLEGAGESWLRARVEAEAGIQAMAAGDLPGAVEHFERSYRFRRDVGDVQGMGSSLVRLADALIDNGELDRVQELHGECVELYQQLGDTGSLSEIERSMGRAALARGDFGAADRFLMSALERAVSIAYTSNTLGILQSMGELFLETGVDRGIDLLAVVAAHPATTPFGRARAEAGMAAAGAAYGTDRLVRARELARSTGLESVAASVLVSRS